jgi:hypothetical protein
MTKGRDNSKDMIKGGEVKQDKERTGDQLKFKEHK